MTNGTSCDGLGRVAGRSMSTTTNGTVATFVDDTITRDTAGRVTQIVDNGVEPDGSPSAVKECFVYDHQHRLVRAHTATPATGCATSTTTASVAPGSRDPYDMVWVFDDLQRITSRTDQLTAATTGYQYGAVRPHAVTGLTGATTASYSYNPAGEMVDRDGTTLAWDPLGRLTGNGTTTSIYGSGPERLIHTVGSTRTLTLPGIDVVDQAGVRTVTRQITVAGTLVALAGGGQVWWNCANLHDTITCQTPAATTLTPAVPARKRFGPYGTARNGTVFAHTDRGYLGAPHDTTGLVHLQHRHHDPQLGVFISVDPLVTTTRQPYLYAAGNPTTLSDPTGLKPASCERDDSCPMGVNSAWGRTAGDYLCILQRCSGSDLVEAIDRRRNSIGGLVFSLIEGADQAGRLDGNWGDKSVDAAANGGGILLDALFNLGFTTEAELVRMYQLATSVAGRLSGHSDSFERIDHERSWWERNGRTVIAIGFITVAAVAVVATGGALAAGAGAYVVGGSGLTWGGLATAATMGSGAMHLLNGYDSCVQGNASCSDATAAAWTDAAVRVATLGVLRGVTTAGSSLGYSPTAVGGARDVSRLYFSVFGLGTSITDARR